MRGNALRPLALLLFITALLLTEAALADVRWPLTADEQGELQQALTRQLGQAPSDDEKLLQHERVQHFYALRNYAPAWSGRTGMVTGASELLSVLREADKEGLQPDRYHLDALAASLGATPADMAALARLDILLTDAFIAYSLDVRCGRFDPRKVDGSWHIYPGEYDVEHALQYALESHSVLAMLHAMPPFQQGYRRLRSALERYRTVAAHGGWPHIAPGSRLMRGVQGPQVAVLRQRLTMSGDLPAKAGGDAQTFDSMVELAVRRFQSRHGIPEEGVVGEETRLELNVPVEQRIGQILASMERWRWMPRDLEQHYLLVNMTGFRLDLIEEDDSVLHMRVIIGSDYRQTPAFGSRVTAMIFNPSWYVPKSIFNKEMLPALRRDKTYLARKNIEILDEAESGTGLDPQHIDWAAYDEQKFPYTVRQPPGSRNPLGRVKFVIPNNYRIYLHDTPERFLFSRRERSFSHGCIRLEHPLELAEYLLSQEPGEKAGEIPHYLSNTRTATLSLKGRWPIYLVYWTAWADEDGVIQFRDDFYNRDTKLIAGLMPEKPQMVGAAEQKRAGVN